MSKIVYNAELLKIMSLFESLTQTKLRDCFIDNNSLLTFVVVENDIGKAIGKRASNVRRIESLLNRKIKIVEFNPSVTQFARNLALPLSDFDVAEEDRILMITGHDAKTKAILIGRNAQNLKNMENTVKKYFDIEKIKVV